MKTDILSIITAIDDLLKTTSFSPGAWCDSRGGESFDRKRRHWGKGTRVHKRSAVDFAHALWDFLQRKDEAAAKKVVFERLRKLVPKAEKLWEEGTDIEPPKDLFLEWFASLAAPEEAMVAPAPPAAPLDLTLEVLVSPTPKSLAAEFRPLGPDVLPVKAGQRLRVKITTNCPAYLYVWWVTPKSEVVPLYPWNPGQWKHLQVQPEQAVMKQELPLRGSEHDWYFTRERGLETLVVLAWKKQMPDSTRDELCKNLAKLPKLPVPKAGLAMRPGPYEWPLGRSGLTASRGVAFNGKPVYDPVQHRQGALESFLAGGYDAGKCLSFLNEG